MSANGEVFNATKLSQETEDGTLYLIILRPPDDDQAFVRDPQKMCMYAVKIGTDDELLKDLVFKKSQPEDQNTMEVLNTIVIAANCPSRFHHKTQLAQIMLPLPTDAAVVTIEHVLQSSKEFEVTEVEGSFYVVGCRTHNAMFPVFHKLVPIDFWHNIDSAADMRKLNLVDERNTLIEFIDWFHRNGYYFNDLKLNNMLLRDSSTRGITMSLCDYGAFEHISDHHINQTTFPSPWLILRFPEWFDNKHKGDNKRPNFNRLKKCFLRMHEHFFVDYDWDRVWQHNLCIWDMMSEDQKKLDTLTFQLNDLHGLGTIFLKLHQQADELGLDTITTNILYDDLLMIDPNIILTLLASYKNKI